MKNREILEKDDEKKFLTLQMVQAIERLKELQKENNLDGEDIAKKTGIQNSNLSKILNFQRAIPMNLLINLYEKYGWSSDYILFGIELSDKKEISEKPSLKVAIQTILDNVGDPTVLYSDSELASFQILHLNRTQKNQIADRLILQNEICGRRKNVIPIRVDDKGKMNILLFTKRKGRKG
jgi:transcriptional regulator with XRE-family HTH domain